MAGITQNKQTRYFVAIPRKNLDNKKSKKGVRKIFKDTKTACKREQCKLIFSTGDS